MKKILLTLFVLVASINLSQAKPGGWIKDFFQNNSVSIGPGYFSSSPAYYHSSGSTCYSKPVHYSRPTYYYYSTPVVYERSYYCPPPRMIPMQPYQNHYRNNYYYGR